jgi:hypothetical protein
MNKTAQRLLNAVVALLGLYMIVGFGKGTINPPMVSGIAIMLLGIVGLMK